MFSVAACACAASASSATKARVISAEPIAKRRWSLRAETKFMNLSLCCLVLQDADGAALAGRFEVDGPCSGGEDRVVAAEAGSLAGPEAGAALADDDLAAGHLLAGEDLDPEHLQVRFATVAAGAESFLVSHS